MTTSPGWIRAHVRIVIVVLIVGVFLIVFFLVPVLPVVSGCATLRDSLGYYLFKVGYHMLVFGCQ